MFYKTLHVSLVALALIFSGCTQETAQETSAPLPRSVKIMELHSTSSPTKSIEFPAQLYALQDTTLAFEVSGKITNFHFQEGQRVKKGETIATLDDVLYQANRNLALANYNQAKADLERNKELYAANALSKANYEKYKQNLEVTQAQYQIAQKNLEETILKAEFDGILAKKIITDFARITAKQPIAILQDISALKVKFFIPEKEIVALQGPLTPQNASDHIDFDVFVGNDKKHSFKARPLHISTTAEQTTRTFEVTLLIEPKEDIVILPGMTATVKATRKKERSKTLFVPFSAIFSDATKKSYVWKVDNGNRITKQEVSLGQIVGDSIEITQGLGRDAKIVTSGVQFLRENEIVKPYEKLGN